MEKPETGVVWVEPDDGVPPVRHDHRVFHWGIHQLPLDRSVVVDVLHFLHRERLALIDPFKAYLFYTFTLFISYVFKQGFTEVGDINLLCDLIVRKQKLVKERKIKGWLIKRKGKAKKF